MLENEFDLSVVSLTPLAEEARDLAKVNLVVDHKIQYKSILSLLKEQKFFNDVDVFSVWSTPFLQIVASTLSFYSKKPTVSFIYSYPDVISDLRYMSIHEVISALLNTGGISFRDIMTSPPISLPIIFSSSRLPLLRQILVQNNKRKQSIIKLGAPTDKVHVVKIGIDTDLFRPKKESTITDSYAQSDKVKIAYFGPLSTFRGVDTLLKAYKEVKENHKDAELHLIGRSSEPSPIINSMINKLDLKNEVTVINQFLPETRLISLMQNFDVIISLLKSSVHAVEPPFIVLEAMSLAKPVISTPLNGVDEIITHKETGLLAKPNAVDSAASAIEYFLDDRKRRQAIGKKAREFIVNNHDIKIFLNDFSESIKKAVV